MATKSTSSVAVIGSTGLVGSNILKTLLASPSTYDPVTTISRRAPANTESSPASLQAVIEPDNKKWATTLSSLSPIPSAVFSALGTTRGAAGGIQQQWAIDHDLNVELAKSAHAAGVKTYVFISSAGTRSFLGSRAPYSQMKNGVEDAIRELDFEHGVILKPGTILGSREESRTAEAMFQNLVRGLGKVNGKMRDSLGQDADIIGRAAVRAAKMAEEGKAPSKFWILYGEDILRIGKAEGVEEKKPAETSS